MDEFKPKVPLMVALHRKGMVDRHWQQISDRVGFEIKPNMQQAEEFTFQLCLDRGLMKNVDFIVDIGEKATKEFHIENLLNQMSDQWSEINFVLKPHKGTWILGGFDDIMVTLDDHIV